MLPISVIESTFFVYSYPWNMPWELSKLSMTRDELQRKMTRKSDFYRPYQVHKIVNELSTP